ncbi:Phosphoglycolate phosphatase [Tepidimonas sediminis]|uniref:phosphoglycolate phosphatase n=1 Tax=Tepidimonas sediminis TaxID=2588941 RepID=A0A554WS86_9BURK|nr:HAD-IA family hydrolase [Tepidimonas sediminis]TSE26448.1 Phosphoglycolate phosphatase [Tepidimonas sediminis]
MSVRWRDVRAVLFDLDGTLLDTAPDLGHAANLLRQRRGLPPLPLARYRPHASSGARGMLAIALGLQPGDDGFEAARAEYLAVYEEVMLRATAPFEGVLPLVQALDAAGLPWGVVTNKVERFALPIAARVEPLPRAAVVIGGDTTPHAKPHPAPLLEAARRLGLEPAACLYVGDDERDIVAGRAAGMRTVAARYGYLGHAADVATWGADAHIDHPQQLLNFLELP